MGEADRLLTVFTRDRGKLNLLAKGVRRAASRKAGHIEPFTYTDLLVAKGANLDLVTQAETIEPHRRVREDLWLSSLAYYVVELADAFTQDEDPNALLFDWTLETLPLAPEVNFLSLERGGCLCPPHGANVAGTIALPVDVLKVFRYLQRYPWEQIAALQLRPDVLAQVESILARYIVFHLERGLRAPVFVDRLRRAFPEHAPEAQG